jgi:transposase
MNLLEPILNLDKEMEILDYEIQENMVFLRIKSSKQSASCPDCKQVSTRGHSFYHRLVKDLPVGERSVYLRVQIRKWFCSNPTCPTHIFVERFAWLPTHKTYTKRLEDFLRTVSFSTSCLQAEQICSQHHISVSHDTLLRVVKDTPLNTDHSPFCRHR